ncbi:integron integrase [Paraglaciecola aquimarina]|uniref:Integron integrase n=1 Tax=Paraglaciecola algarum TaxID=3050085 RepID=A0ABS9DCB9_9ALTE|nr:integron integrase [Paraglaciecola sp. G1-23]MCF2949658.1 integron integrase [Paraglaciecola sp. G1-23]
MTKSPFLESVRQEIRTMRYSIKTEKSYLWWIKGFILFNDKKHPNDMGNHEIERFLNHLAINRQVSSATQNQALCAIIFMYKNVIQREIKNLKYGFTKRDRAIPTVLTHEEAMQIIGNLKDKYWLIASLLYGCGLRINEALKLRVKDLNLADNTLFVFRGKGRKDRYTLLPKSLNESIKNQIEKAKLIHHKDTCEGYGLTSLPPSLIRKYGHAAKDFSWQYLFPSSIRCEHPHDGYICRHHIHETAFRKQLRQAVLKTGIAKRVKAHTFRHTFATQLLLNGTDIRTVQELLGHSDLRTTELYTHVIGSRFSHTISPFDRKVI